MTCRDGKKGLNLVSKPIKAILGLEVGNNIMKVMTYTR